MIEKMSILIFMSVFFALSITETHIIGVAFLYDLLTVGNVNVLQLNSRYRNAHIWRTVDLGVRAVAIVEAGYSS